MVGYSVGVAGKTVNLPSSGSGGSTPSPTTIIISWGGGKKLCRYAVRPYQLSRHNEYNVPSGKLGFNRYVNAVGLNPTPTTIFKAGVAQLAERLGSLVRVGSNPTSCTILEVLWRNWLTHIVEGDGFVKKMRVRIPLALPI